MMSHVYRCPLCGSVIEETDRVSFVISMEKHFRRIHPDEDYTKHLSLEFI